MSEARTIRNQEEKYYMNSSIRSLISFAMVCSVSAVFAQAPAAQAPTATAKAKPKTHSQSIAKKKSGPEVELKPAEPKIIRP